MLILMFLLMVFMWNGWVEKGVLVLWQSIPVSEISILIDGYSTLFLMIISVVSYVVNLYSYSYMSGSFKFGKFNFLMIMFVMSMSALCLSGNLFWSMVGWDGLGLFSILLILFYKNSLSVSGSFITYLYNRTGDMFFMVAVMILLREDSSMAVVMSFMAMLACMTKSAQFPFSVWLPLAMVAPTPVSSLVHSSTLITAGVWILIRFPGIISSSVIENLWWVSGVTILYATVLAITDSDLKSVVAYSTLSHIGFMMFLISQGESNIAFIHMCMHAIFKSMLFMVCGVMFHKSGGSQDLRFINLNWKEEPLMSFFMNTSVFGMIGLPFVSGFYSKELFIISSMGGPKGYFSIIIILATIWYSIRILVNLFSSWSSSPPHPPMIGGSYKMTFLSFFFNLMVGIWFFWMMDTESQMKESYFSSQFYKLIVLFLIISTFWVIKPFMQKMLYLFVQVYKKWFWKELMSGYSNHLKLEFYQMKFLEKDYSGFMSYTVRKWTDSVSSTFNKWKVKYEFKLVPLFSTLIPFVMAIFTHQLLF
uniref:NADH-ubiquinone oxidoreductase chain 5 n=1 Tax=Microthoracius praelongiceps TaxID=1958934 RepID=A0A1S5XVS0_9NEOP|nr:NADH dehydrogenase subunit 5 [Microthoracius praelongiceps]